MTITFDTSTIRPADRAELIRETIWNAVVKVEIQHIDDPTRIRATGRIRSLGPISICSVRSNATTVVRTPRLTHDGSEPSLFLGLQVSGSSMVIQAGRQAVLGPGDLALYDTTEPYTLLNRHGIDQHFFRIPLDQLRLSTDIVRRSTAVRFGCDHPLVDIASSYFARLAGQQSVLDARSADALGQPSIELIRALLLSRSPRGRSAAVGADDALVLRILEHIRANLADTDLAPARLAAQHNISVRQLYTVLDQADIALGDWIRHQRLERCRQELATAAARHRTIESVARGSGFVNAAHFARSFRGAYGMTPRQWRASCSRAAEDQRPTEF